ncbi:energy-coupling factor ABC transporter ATP-binding protein [Fredinandcohnia salidurans]|uniref:Energy-coupling factor ABC transporter ATP-binding protein n=1 Tax=Fredinandcohnia salidurans TaxID=2595041 RepID=A0ABW4MV17_9BACI
MSHIQIQNLSYKYPLGKNNVLQNINLEIENGKLYTIVGENGSGKTTLCNILRGFIPWFHKGELDGSVIIDGKDLLEYELEDLALKVGYVFQNPFTQISGIKETVFEEIAYGLENLGVESIEIEQRVNDVMNLLGIQYLKDKHPMNLSGGQKQRVVFASIIVMEPDILVIDEPTSQLDPQGTEEIFNIINIMKQKGKTIILVEHKMELIAEYSDYVLVLKDGELVISGKTEIVLTDERLLTYLGSLPQYARLGIEMIKNDLLIEKIPITERESIEIIMKCILQENKVTEVS